MLSLVVVGLVVVGFVVLIVITVITQWHLIFFRKRIIGIIFIFILFLYHMSLWLCIEAGNAETS